MNDSFQKKVSKINKGNIMKNKTVFMKKKLVNDIQKQYSIKENITNFNNSTNNKSINSSKTNQNTNIYFNKKKECVKVLKKNNNNKNNYTKVNPVNKNTNINLFIITNTRNIFDSGNNFNYIKYNKTYKNTTTKNYEKNNQLYNKAKINSKK